MSLRTAGLANWEFVIPAGHPNYEVFAEYTFKEDALFVSFLPHMHLRGSAAKFEAFYPDGTSKVPLNVPKYDFNWQTTYRYKEFGFVPKGTKIVSTSVFDNSADNPSNPDPTVDVRYGDRRPRKWSRVPSSTFLPSRKKTWKLTSRRECGIS